MIEITDKNRPLRGVFVLRIIDKQGHIVEEYKDANMIVNAARTSLTYLVGEGSPNKVITKFAVGTSNTTATPTDTGLTNMYINTLIGHSYPDASSIKFDWRLDYDEANELNICEFGLLCEDNTLFSRKVRAPIYKASDLAFEGEWTIIF